jgi:hypothetical protein
MSAEPSIVASERVVGSLTVVIASGRGRTFEASSRTPERPHERR